jgi:hypothetical protein
MTEAGIGAVQIQASIPGRCAWLCCLAVSLVVSLLAATQDLCAQRSKPTEYEVEAAYLSNFGRFIEWPPRAGLAANEPFNVCVLGQDPFGSLLDGALKGEDIGGASLVARRVSGVEDAANCRILFISSSKDAELKAILTTLGTSSILTVSDTPGFTKRGGMLQFVIDGDRVRFEINITAAQRNGLNLSSQLLKLAITVRRAP